MAVHFFFFLNCLLSFTIPCSLRILIFLYNSGSLQVTAPPSPLVIGLTGWKLKTVASLYLQSPIKEFLYLDPNACEASSTILNLYFFDK